MTFEAPVVFVDIETTGGSYRSNRIIEIALIRYEKGKITKEYQTLINPRVRVPQHITNLTGIREADLETAPYFEDIASDIYEILKGAVFAAHNVHFDFSFVRRQLADCDYNIRPKLLCSVKLSRALYPDHRAHSLQKIIERHQIKVDSRHRAYDDAYAVLKFMNIAYEQHGLEKFSQAINKQLKRINMPSHLDDAAIDNIQNVPGVYIFEDDAGVPIYVGKSVKLRSRVMSHFASAKNNGKEMKLSQNVHNLRTVETNSELEALLLESEMVKKLLPIYNRKLRRAHKQSLLIRKLDEAGYANIVIDTVSPMEIDQTDNIYGVFPNRSKAKEALLSLQKSFDLCSKLLGLESGEGACFQYQLKRCKGVCKGHESAELYNARLEIALERIKLETWRYKHPIAIQLSSERSVVVDQWSIVGYIEHYSDQPPIIEKVERVFDLDVYKILRSHLKQNKNFKILAPNEALSF